MPELAPHPDSLVLFKGKPGRVRHVGKTIEIESTGGEHLNVRSKDVTVLHPGPLRGLGDLTPVSGDVETAWELLAEGSTTLAELAELAYGAFTPATAWAAWQLVADGLLFRGTPQQITARSEGEVQRERSTRQARAAEAEAWSQFVAGAKAGDVSNVDARYLREVEEMALGRSEKSRLLREMRRTETRENAHALLMEMGHWTEWIDPYPQRMGVTTAQVTLEVPVLPDEARLDLTGLPAFAIDDEGNEEPDDAVGLEGHRLWVHVADAAALAPSGSALDLEARARGATLYLPEGPVRMLPKPAVEVLGLGLAEVSPALSFCVEVDGTGRARLAEYGPSWIRVTRLSYAEAQQRLSDEPLASLMAAADTHRERRRGRGALFLELPEVQIQVAGGEVTIRPLPALESRDLVMEGMLMAGEAIAGYAQANSLPLPFTSQEPPAEDEAGGQTATWWPPDDLAGMYAMRQRLRPSQYASAPCPHAGLGLASYVQATSPLRRYLDLVTHQQLRAHKGGQGQLDAREMTERVGATMAVAGTVRATERLARRHWTLVYLMHHPDWEGDGVLVERRGRRGIALIPSLDLDTAVHLRRDTGLNERLRLALPQVNLPLLEVRFEVVE
ncbi:MAG TPA: RNB domain-containing ribonuclease [Anaerolineae bacterium]|nr:RNB domain-containing ribonuclease [Anaerolineae bacterium]